MVSRNEIILHVELLRKIIHDLRMIQDSKGYNHLVTDNTHLASVHCNHAIDKLHQLIGEELTKEGTS